MIGRYIQRREVVKIVLNLRALVNGKACRTEDFFDPLKRQRYGVQATGMLPTAWQSDVD
jgi:hypothetical protein